MTTEKPVQQLMEELYAAWSSWDVERLLPLFTDDVAYEDVALGIVCRGKDEFRAFAQRYFAATPQHVFRYESAVADASHVAAEALSGNLRYVSVMELEDGKIKRSSDYWDLAGAARRLGVLSETWVSERGMAWLKAVRGD